ncbi:MAG: fibronectin type III domain-containing protein, partial [Flavobacteriales bacterium]
MTKLLIALVLSTFGWQANAQVYLTTSGGSYPTEKWCSISTGVDGTGTIVWQQGGGPIGTGSGLLTNEAIALPSSGTYYLNCYDQYDDSWDGTVYDLTDGTTTIINNGGTPPDDGTDIDASGGWDGTADELESSEAFTYTAPACPTPTTLTANNITTTTADLGWTENGTATTWDIEHGATGFTQGSGTTVTGTTTNPHNLSGLTANTTYDFYVRADCGGSGTSTW